MFPGSLQWRDEIGEITLIRAVGVSDETSSDDIRGNRIGRAVNAQLIEPLDLVENRRMPSCPSCPESGLLTHPDALARKASELLALMSRSTNFSQLVI